MKNFKPLEFMCNCRCGLGVGDMDNEFLVKLDRARDCAGVPFVLNSSIRCSEHNITEGGLADSGHLLGLAVDIKAVNSYHRYRIIYGLIKAGINRIGIGKTFIHADDDSSKPKELCWIY